VIIIHNIERLGLKTNIMPDVLKLIWQKNLKK